MDIENTNGEEILDFSRPVSNVSNVSRRSILSNSSGLKAQSPTLDQKVTFVEPTVSRISEK